MKKLLFAILFSAISAASFGQITIQGFLKRTDSSAVKLDSVWVSPDTGQSFPTRVTLTDTSGFFATQVQNISPGQRIVTRARDCNNVFVTDTQTYNGGNTVNSNLVICIAPTFKITGYVHLGNTTKRPPVGEGRVYLIQKCAGDVLSYIDSTNTDTNGFYSFDPYPTLGSGCNLIMRAAMGNNATEYAKYVPGYHLTNTSYGLKWSSSTEVTTAMGNSGVDILLPEAINNTGGPSEISGIAVDENSAVLRGYIMVITDMNDVTVAYTHTDNNGKFSFGNLPFGTYKVFGDVWGKSNPALVVKVSADELIVSDILFVENNFEYKGWRSTSIDYVNSSEKIVAFPNPIVGSLTINNLPKCSSINLTSVTGRVVYSKTNNKVSKLVIPAGNLPKGVYMLQISNESAVIERLKIVK